MIIVSLIKVVFNKTIIKIFFFKVVILTNNWNNKMFYNKMFYNKMFNNKMFNNKMFNNKMLNNKMLNNMAVKI